MFLQHPHKQKLAHLYPVVLFLIILKRFYIKFYWKSQTQVI